MEAPDTQRPNDRLKNQSQKPHQRNSVEEKVVRFLTVETLVTHIMENEGKWGAITNNLIYIMQMKEEDESQ